MAGVLIYFVKNILYIIGKEVLVPVLPIRV